MFLNLQVHDYDKDIAPFVRNGIIIDTSVFLIILDGIVDTRFSRKPSQQLEQISTFLDLLKVNNRWGKFFVTPHVLTEICTHLRGKYSKNQNYKEIVKEIFPILNDMEERCVKKDEILQSVNLLNPVVEIGDISIFVVADDFASKHTKIAVLANDYELNKRYEDNKDVLVLDYQSNVINLL